jgi:hypothetical protein
MLSKLSAFQSHVKGDLCYTRRTNNAIASIYECIGILSCTIDALSREVYTTYVPLNKPSLLAKLVAIGAAAQRAAEDLQLIEQE